MAVTPRGALGLSERADIELFVDKLTSPKGEAFSCSFPSSWREHSKERAEEERP